MVITAPKSSIMAKAAKNIFNCTGILFPSNERTPSEKAISVAMGIPQPLLPGVGKL